MQPRKSISCIFVVQNGVWVKKGHRSLSKAFRLRGGLQFRNNVIWFERVVLISVTAHTRDY